MLLKKISGDEPLVDGENGVIRLDHAYALGDLSLEQAIAQIIGEHGDSVRLLPLSGMSAAAGVYQVESGNPIVGLHFHACIEPRVTSGESVDIKQIGHDQIIVDAGYSRVYAGSAITLDQLNRGLAAELGPGFRVLGADLTSYTYAQVGACFMTGGMGPQRRYFSDSVIEVALHNGQELMAVEGEALYGYAGTYGWTGMVSAVCCQYFRTPKEEVAFAIPVNSDPHSLARLLQHFADFCFLQIVDDEVKNRKGESALILGLEHLTIESMQPFLRSGNNALVERARQLQHNCELAEADGLIFVNGFSQQAVDDFLLGLVDDEEAEELTIAGINLEHTEVFRDPDQMRAVREGIPYIARMQAPEARFSHKSHTDANIELNPDSVEEAMTLFWKANLDYVGQVKHFFASTRNVSGEILVYGHLNPVGIDPHNRITFASDNEAIFQFCMTELTQLHDNYILKLAELCEETGSKFIGGEKSAASDAEMLPVFGSIDQAPPLMTDKFARQSRVIRNASTLFNWRALRPYI